MPLAPPAFGWPTQLTTFLNQNYNENWAYSGSFAMYCHADRLSKDCREPEDIDILIDGESRMGGLLQHVSVNNVFHLASKLCDEPFDGTASESFAAHDTKATVDNCLIGEHRVKIDMANPSDRFGQLDTDTMSYEGQAGQCRIITIDQLIACKEQADALDEKHRQDLITLRRWQVTPLRKSAPT